MAHSSTIALAERDSVAQLRAAIRTGSDEAQKTRLRAIIGIKEGKTRAAMAQLLVASRTSIISWIAAYNAGGIPALVMSKGGRPEGNPIWDRAIFDELIKEIDKGGRYWSVPLMQEWIKEKYKKEIPENTVWYHVTGLDYTYKSARPHPMQGDAAKQEAFKKGVSRKRSARRSKQEKKNS